MRDFTRRKFLKQSLLATLTVSAAARLPAQEPKWKAAIIGHTGKGDYGHGLDVILSGVPNVEVVALADPSEAGRTKALTRAKAAKDYADYREMLRAERPQLVSVAPRWTDEHFVMCQAALDVGAHVICEKPFTQTLAEADQLLATARQKKLKIAIAHQMRLAPSLRHLKSAIDQGLLGELLEIRAHGKQDSRAGGEDMIVLGTHLFDMMRLLAGDPLWCAARILQDGKEATLRDARKASEGIGSIVGDDIQAHFEFSNGVTGSFASRGKSREIAGHWGLHVVGTKGVARVLADVSPNVRILKAGSWSEAGRTDQWQPVEGDPTLKLNKEDLSFAAANRRVVDDWFASIRSDRDPACSGYNGMKAVEMCHGVFEAGLKKSRVEFPLKNREHPLKTT